MTPAAIMIPRRIIAPRMPQYSARCCSAAGSWKYRKIIAMTKMLSRLSDFSTTYPVRYCSAAWDPVSGSPTVNPTPSQWRSYRKYTATPKVRPRPIQNADQRSASGTAITWARRWKTPRSSASSPMMSARKRNQTIKPSPSSRRRYMGEKP